MTPAPALVQINVDAVVGQTVASARATADVVGLALQLIEEAGDDAVGRSESRFMVYNFGPPPGDPTARRAARRRWLLTKGFQDLTVAVRRALEEADVLLAVAATPSHVTTLGQLNTWVAGLRRVANRSNLPDLLARVEDRIGSALNYRADILSLNQARNCLEHRAGVVEAIDCDPQSDVLTVRYPRMRIFYVHQGAEVEIDMPHHQMPEAEEGDGFDVMMQRITETLVFGLGDAVDVSAAQFAEMTFAVWFFANDLAKAVRESPSVSALPKPSAAVTDAVAL